MKPLAKVLLFIAFALLLVFSLQRIQLESSKSSLNERRLGLNESEPAASTNVVDGSTNVVAEKIEGNEPELTNTTSTAVVGSTNTNVVAAIAGGTAQPPSRDSGQKSGLGAWLAGFVIGLLGLAGLIGWEFTQWFARRTNRGLGFDVDAPKEKPPEYEAAEEEWAKGNHLDAIGLMREYLAKNPNEQYVALRIAEIYEKDLGNYLAAALEYEEILKRSLPREKWGWTALRLSNLYSGRLNQPDNAIELLNRVIAEYGETAAAKKARERLGVPEPVEPLEVSTETAVEEAPESQDPNLPKGFRRKK